MAAKHARVEVEWVENIEPGRKVRVRRSGGPVLVVVEASDA